VGNFLGAHSLFVDSAAGFDLVNISYASFGENLYVWLGGDSDQATVYAASADYLSVDAGSGYDAVAIQYSAADHLFAGLGYGNDSLATCCRAWRSKTSKRLASSTLGRRRFRQRRGGYAERRSRCRWSRRRLARSRARSAGLMCV
jgi:hypothetical protein